MRKFILSQSVSIKHYSLCPKCIQRTYELRDHNYKVCRSCGYSSMDRLLDEEGTHLQGKIRSLTSAFPKLIEKAKDVVTDAAIDLIHSTKKPINGCPA